MELMFDIETLDTKPNAVVLSIGAVTFDTFLDTEGHFGYAIADRFYRVLDMQAQLDRGRTISQGTLLWWLRQDPTARAEAFNPIRCSVGKALCAFSDFVNRYADPEVGDPGITKFWCNGPSFDGVIMESLAYDYGGVPLPWRYNQLRDQRTLVDAAGLSIQDHRPNIAGVPHTPIYDCEFQISVIAACRNKLRKR